MFSSLIGMILPGLFIPTLILYGLHGFIYDLIIEPLAHNHRTAAKILTAITAAPAIVVAGCTVWFIITKIAEVFQ